MRRTRAPRLMRAIVHRALRVREDVYAYLEDERNEVCRQAVPGVLHTML
jgi:hypothetical protein